MDTVLELAARATSYFILLQDALALGPAGPRSALWQLLPGDEPALYQAIKKEPMLLKKAEALFNSATGLPAGSLKHKPALKKSGSYETHTAALLVFLRQQHVLMQPEPAAHRLAPEAWRRALQRLLYRHPASRVALARALDYLPTLVYELVGAPEPAPAPELTERRATWPTQLMRWAAKNVRLKPAAASPAAHTPLFWVYYLQLSNEELAVALKNRGLAVPFEVMLSQELAEVAERRKAHPSATAAPAPADVGPLCQADGLGLCALALSGGGIRTATFNLGLLQGLASAGWLPRFDYLSTVSGGGYIGSWLATWIQREGSLAKVTARLCPGSSPRPQADEVRAIRWLRMYSNYLAPKTGRLTADSWTIGVTWLRNTLLNQFIIVLALGAALALSHALLYGWLLFSWDATPNLLGSQWQVLVASLLMLAPATVLASWGMRPFRDGQVQPPGRFFVAAKWLLLLWAALAAYAASGFLYHSHNYYPGFVEGWVRLWPVAVWATAALLAVAWWGRYDKSFYHSGRSQKDGIAWARLIIIGSSVLAAAVGVAGLVGVWKLLTSFYTLPEAISQPVPTPGQAAFWPQVQLYVAFMLGVPLVLEALVGAVVTRMALLGRNFPDERREWWGRMGAVLHRAMAAWLLLASSMLLMRCLGRLLTDPDSLGIDHLHSDDKGLEGLLAALLAGSWLTLIGKAVQLAASARTRATKPDAPGASSRLDRVLNLAPYVFGLGLLVLTQGAVYWLLHYWLPEEVRQVPWAALPVGTLLGRSLLLSGVLAVAAMGLGYRVGVNEFSLHHFYRNRLVRAYLGASRFRFDRERTANPFTDFDSNDDVKLCTLRHTAVPAAAQASSAQEASAAPDTSAPYDGPFLLINATLNATKVSDLAQQDRQAESFVFTPLYCGFDFAPIRALNPTRQYNSFGYRPTEQYAYPNDYGPYLGTAMAISGAAASPNEGYHSSQATAFLLTLFNLRLGWWMGNPSKANFWQKADPKLGLLYLFKDLFGRSTASDAYVNLSDGGHFDNMGLYELVRRRCRYIVLGDGEEDHLFTCEGLANAIRRCRVDFGVEITIDVTPITNRQVGHSRRHYAVGTIHYPEDPADQPAGYLLYIKSSLTGNEPTDVREYAQANDNFPHQSTGDQFFNEAQFESYRRLGLHVFETLAADCRTVANPSADLKTIFRQLATTCAKPIPEAPLTVNATVQAAGTWPGRPLRTTRAQPRS